MERLEACYFCGTAEDAPLREVSVTPRSRRGEPDPPVSLTLCRSCERKLERVLGGLFERVESRETAAGAAEPDEGTAPTASTGEGPSEPEPIYPAEGPSTEPEDEPRSREEPLADPPDASAPNDGDDERTTASPADGDKPESIGEEPVTARATATVSKPFDGVSVAEYNTVMRLLQNREFPMARGAFVDLATNAYDLAEGTVEAVLEAVIEQGALADRDGELVRPGEEGSA